MSNRYLRAVWESGRYTGALLIVLVYLADRADESGECWPGAAAICKATRLDRRTLFRALKRLCADGIVERYAGQRKSNVYRINIDRLSSGDMPLGADCPKGSGALPLLVGAYDPQSRGVAPPDLPKKPQKATVKPQAPADPRHGEVRALIQQACEVNEVPFVWDGSEAKVLGDWLKANPRLEVKDITKLIHCRFRSEGIALGERPRRWIADLGQYAEGPLDRFKRLRQGQHSEALVGTLR